MKCGSIGTRFSSLQARTQRPQPMQRAVSTMNTQSWALGLYPGGAASAEAVPGAVSFEMTAAGAP